MDDPCAQRFLPVSFHPASSSGDRAARAAA
jgi:hypothetical protein